jgi:multicomponent Na+:H+ antiporter subunit D
VNLLPWLVALPLMAALAVFLLPIRWRAPGSILAAVFLGLVSIYILVEVIRKGVLIHALAGWAAPLGIRLQADGFAAGMVVLTALVTMLCAVQAATYLRGKPEEEGFWPLLWFMWAALNSIWLSADLFNLFVGVELLGLTAVGLVALNGSAQSLAAAMRYLLATLLGALFYLIGVALIYAALGSLALADLAGHGAGMPTVLIALVLMTFGLALKTALFPLHGWLPPAHGGAALTPVSALLSALVIKAALYILIRLWITLDVAVLPVPLAWILGLMGSGAILWGGWMALRQDRLKSLVAYSTVAQVGYLFLFFPLVTGTAATNAVLAWDATVLMLISHALAKAGMFLAAGNLVFAIGSPRITDLAGICHFRPFSLLSFGVAGVSLAGLPPSGGFNAKWLLIQSALASEQWLWLPVLILGGLLSAAYVIKVLGHSFVEGPVRDHFLAPPLPQELSAFLLASASLVIGLVSQAPLTWLRIGGPFAGGG